MTLENATYINELVQNYPEGDVSVSGGNDHLQLIKTVLQNTFPNVTGEVTAEQSALNQLQGSSTINQNVAPVGMITLWYGDTTNIPDGWGLCDGSSYTDRDGNSVASPDLRNMFVVGAGNTSNDGADYSPGDTGGEKEHVLTTEEMPPHDHGGTTGETAPNNNVWESQTGGRNVQDSSGGSESKQGTNHSHSIESDGGDADGNTVAHENRPPYHALCFIIKL